MVQTLFVRTAGWIGATALILFGAAGTFNWPAAWFLLGSWALLGLSTGMWFAKHDPALLAERLKPMIQKDQPRADKIFVAALGLIFLIWFVVIALDAARFRGSHVPLWVQVFGFFLSSLAVIGASLALRENTFAAPVIRVQTERGHHVITTGLYAYIRHPMYAAVIPFFGGVPLLLGSWWGLAFAPIFIVLFMARIMIEERTLRSSLGGYSDYAARVQYRLIPGIW